VTPLASQGLPIEPRSQAWGRWLGLAAGIAIFAVALYALREQFSGGSLQQAWFAVSYLDPIFLLRATLFAIGAYAVLIAYDILALRYIARDLPIRLWVAP